MGEGAGRGPRVVGGKPPAASAPSRPPPARPPLLLSCSVSTDAMCGRGGRAHVFLTPHPITCGAVVGTGIICSCCPAAVIVARAVVQGQASCCPRRARCSAVEMVQVSGRLDSLQCLARACPAHHWTLLCTSQLLVAVRWKLMQSATPTNCRLVAADAMHDDGTLARAAGAAVTQRDSH